MPGIALSWNIQSTLSRTCPPPSRGRASLSRNKAPYDLLDSRLRVQIRCVSSRNCRSGELYGPRPGTRRDCSWRSLQLRIVNGDRLGLQAAVFTRGIGTAYRFVEELEVARSP
jgi:hypothetical protein